MRDSKNIILVEFCCTSFHEFEYDAIVYIKFNSRQINIQQLKIR